MKKYKYFRGGQRCLVRNEKGRVSTMIYSHRFLATKEDRCEGFRAGEWIYVFLSLEDDSVLALQNPSEAVRCAMDDAVERILDGELPETILEELGFDPEGV